MAGAAGADDLGGLSLADLSRGSTFFASGCGGKAPPVAGELEGFSTAFDDSGEVVTLLEGQKYHAKIRLAASAVASAANDA